jgi:hypothetical protein
LEKKKDEKEKLVDKLNLQKEKIKIKVKCFQNHRNSNYKATNRNTTNKRPSNYKTLENEAEDDNIDLEVNINEEILSDINSDVDNQSVLSFQTESNTSCRESVQTVNFDSLKDNLSDTKISFFSKSLSGKFKDEEIKKMYKNFVKVFLKIKFEKIICKFLLCY